MPTYRDMAVEDLERLCRERRIALPDIEPFITSIEWDTNYCEIDDDRYAETLIERLVTADDDDAVDGQQDGAKE